MNLRRIGVLFVKEVAGGPKNFLFIFADYASPELLLAQSLALTVCMLALRGAMGLVFAREYTREALREARGSGE